MLTQCLHSAGFPTGGTSINLGYSRAPANVAAVGLALSQYSEPTVVSNIMLTTLGPHT